MLATLDAHIHRLFGGRWGTYAVGEVGDQVSDLDLARLELAVHPAGVRLATWRRTQDRGKDAHHFVNVFCWTLTQCCSSGAMFAGCVHQAAEGRAMNMRGDIQCLLCLLAGVGQTID